MGLCDDRAYDARVGDGVWNLAAALPQVAAPAMTAPLVTALDTRSTGLGPRPALACVILEFAIGTAWLWRLRRT